jgi:two-component system, sensor histidine kinase and response regulator
MTKILVIEDETILRKEVMRWLNLEDFEVIGAGDGVEGLELAFQHLPDLILCDIALPQRDGYDVMLDIRANPQTQLTPFIFITARASHEDIRKGMSLGADDYITKPFTRVDLLEAIQTALAKRDLLEQHHQFELEQWREALKHEQEQRIFKAKLIGMFSHDFRNPLASIKSSNGILHKHSHRMDDNQRLVHFTRIDKSVNHLLQMLEDMLVVAQLDAGQLRFRPELLNISDFIQEIIEEFQTICGEKYPIVYTPEFSESVMADSRLLRQIVSNLVSNAIKYSPEDKPIEVNLALEKQNLLLTVQDYGIGIPEAEQDQLFNAFQRASNVGNIAGTGLGLAIVRQAVEIHGGRIQLESQLGLGTRVTVQLSVE